MTEKEYNMVVAELTNRVCRFADKMLMEREAAKDIAQEAFMALWQNRQKVEYSKAKSWLFTTSYRMAIAYSKRRSKHNGEIGDLVMDSAPQPDIKKIIEESLLLLNDVQRSILLLRDMEGYNYAEIGEILALSESQVKVYLFRARTKIKEYIRDINYVI
jgi:RNA polymerase sigma factor (sigma-70 family)